MLNPSFQLSSDDAKVAAALQAQNARIGDGDFRRSLPGMRTLAIIIGIALILAVLADLVNTLVTTSTSKKRWWLTPALYSMMWGTVGWLADRIRSEPRREALLTAFAPVSVLVLLTVWVTQQIIGFALIWWGTGDVSGAGNFGDALYYSGVVYFTLGFGELVPAAIVPRIGALIEAFSGVLTTALVIGYLPALYAAFSDRERKLMLLDDGTEDRITPTSLVISRSPNGDPKELEAFFAEWEHWMAGVIETHTTFPMLRFFRSKDPKQNWVTALGLVTDAALHLLMVRGAERGSHYWMLRRSIKLFQTVVDGVDLSEYERQYQQASAEGSLFRQLYDRMEEHGFDLVEFDEARRQGAEIRSMYAPGLEYLIDHLRAPRGFWGHAIGHAAVDPARQVD